LRQNESLASQIDAAVVVSKSDEWRDNLAKENLIKEAIYKIVDNVEEVEYIIAIVKQQHDY
jgi:type I restriction enzyme R subunit